MMVKINYDVVYYRDDQILNILMIEIIGGLVYKRSLIVVNLYI